jgi:DNA topoisomerase-3
VEEEPRRRRAALGPALERGRRVRDRRGGAGRAGERDEEAKPSTQAAPLLYDLTSLQREANSRFGFSARTTLSIAQALYEKHKVLTYPRTDSRALPEDYVAVARQTIEMIAKETLPGPLRPLAVHARTALKENYVKPSKKIFDNAKVSDHFAIIPTLLPPKSLSEIEAKLYDMVAKRFLAVFFPPAEFMVTTRISTVAKAGKEYKFQTNGKVMVKPGWLAVYGREAQEDDANLVAVAKDELARTESVDVKALKTKPPARYTEATLLSAMEGAGKLIDDDELREAMQEKGLGTPATRAAIIEGLIYEKYIHREGRELVPGREGVPADDAAARPRRRGPDQARAHRQLGVPARRDGKGPPRALDLHEAIAEMAERIVKKAKEYDRDTIPGDYATLAVPCPNCGGVVKENYRRYACTGIPGERERCGFSMSKIPGGRAFELAEVEAFLRDKRIGPLEGFRSKAGWPFTAELKLVRDDEAGNWKLEFDFGEDARREGESGEPVDFGEQESLGACPKTRGKVYEFGTNYVCEHSVGPAPSCDFKSGKVILQQPVAREQMTKLLTTGATDLLDGFVSNKTRRKFKARLAWDAKENKVVFAFEPRPERKPAAKKASAATKPAAGAKAAAAAKPAAAVTAVDAAPAKKAPARKVTAVRKADAKTAARPAAKKSV